MKQQILMFQQRLAEKENKYIMLDNELRSKKKEFEKLQRKIEEGKEGSLPLDANLRQGGMLMRVNNHQQPLQ